MDGIDGAVQGKIGGGRFHRLLVSSHPAVFVSHRWTSRGPLNCRWETRGMFFFWLDFEIDDNLIDYGMANLDE